MTVPARGTHRSRGERATWSISLVRQELLAELTAISFNTFSLDDMLDALLNFDFGRNPVRGTPCMRMTRRAVRPCARKGTRVREQGVYLLVFIVSGLNFVTLFFAKFRLHRRLLHKDRDDKTARSEKRAQVAAQVASASGQG